jgi:hypothetical protein
VFIYKTISSIILTMVIIVTIVKIMLDDKL